LRAAVLLLLLIASVGVGAKAESTEALEPLSPAESGNPLPVRDDQWRFTIAFPMLWAPSIDGKIRGDEPIDFSISFDDILENLSFGIMFELYANRNGSEAVQHVG